MDRSRYYQGYTKVLSGSVSSMWILEKVYPCHDNEPGMGLNWLFYVSHRET